MRRSAESFKELKELKEHKELKELKKLKELPKIAHIVHSLHYGGLENGVVNIVNRSRFPSVIICLEEAGEMVARLSKKCPVYELHKGNGIKPYCIVRILRILKHERVALVHTHNWCALCYAGPAASLAGAVLLHGQHGLGENDYPPSRVIGRLFNLWVDRFVPVSPAMTNKIRPIFGAGSEKIHPIINGVDTRRFRPDKHLRRKMRENLGIAEKAYLLGFIGRLVDWKRAHFLPEMVKELVDRQQDIHAVLVGDGPYREKIRSLAKRLNVSDRVHILGFRSDVSEILQALDILVLPSEDREGTPNVVLEAMACGVLTVACNLAGLKGLIEDGIEGVLLSLSAEPRDFATAIDALIKTPDRLQDLSQSCMRRCRKDFTLIRMVKEYDSLYEEAVCTPRSIWSA